MAVKIYGIRHHGPGSARSLVAALERSQPQLVLIEGPPDAQDELAALRSDEFEPPVALVVHRVDDPRRAVFYPFAEYSPEWQALRFALRRGIEVRWCDLAWTHRFADTAEDAPAREQQERHDPLDWLARADGYTDGERWWNDRIEERGDDSDVFAAVREALGALRAELALEETLLEQRREAAMRRAIRQAIAQGIERVAVVCGAWHAPALELDKFKRGADEALLKGLGKTKVAATWSPWTNERLTFASGYGAGVASPGWYEQLWSGEPWLMEHWITRAARALRSSDIDASSASVIEAVRLSETLAALRGRGRPGLPESLEAVRHVLANGNDAWSELLRRRWLVGERLGRVPDGVARLPLEQDLNVQRRKLRLEPTAAPHVVQLDLREPGGRARSAFLHRLQALAVPWGVLDNSARSRGTFKEVWTLQWKPEFALALVDAASFGNTVEQAAGARLVETARGSLLAKIVDAFETALLADLPAAADVLLTLVRDASAQTGEVDSLLDAVPTFARLVRYGSVREADRVSVSAIVAGLIARVHVALPAAVVGLDEAAAAALVTRLRAHHAALTLLADRAAIDEELEVLLRIADQESADPSTRGLAVRLLRESARLDGAAVAAHWSRQLSRGADASAGARWLDGFLGGAGSTLVHDTALIALLDTWLAGLSDEHFQVSLPILRRTFSSFHAPERRALAAVVCSGARPRAQQPTHDALELDLERASPAIAAVARILGLGPASVAP